MFVIDSKKDRNMYQISKSSIYNKKEFRESFQTAIHLAMKTGNCYYVCFPDLFTEVNSCDSMLETPICHCDYQEDIPDDDIAFTVFPDGTIKLGKVLEENK